MPVYTFTTLDDPLGMATVAYGISNAGQVVGAYTDANLHTHSFLYSGGTFTTLDDPSATTGTLALGINDAGQIVGYYTDASSAHGFLYSGGFYTTLDIRLREPRSWARSAWNGSSVALPSI